jgi:hypothetical protein
MMLVSARLTADEAEMVAALRRAREEMGRLSGTVANSTEATRRASTGNEALSRSTRQVVDAQRQGQSVTEREAQTRTRAAQAGDRLAGSAESVRRTTRALAPDVQRAEQATRQFQGAMSNAAASAALVNGPLGGVASRFSTLAALSGRMNLAAVGVTVGLSAMVLGAGRAVRAFTDLERQQLTVQGTLQATGFAAGRTAGQLEDMARRIAVDTLASAREVRAAQTVLLTFRSVAGETFDRAIDLSQDLAAAGFGTLEGNAVQLGKALEDPVAGLTALTRVGVSFSPTARKMIRDFVEMGQSAEAQRLILEGVAAQVEGLGRAAGAGAAGGFDLVGENTIRFFELLGTNLNGDGRIGQFLTTIANGIEVLNRALEGPSESDRSQEIVAENNRLVVLLEERQSLLDEIAAARGRGQDLRADALENSVRLGILNQQIAETETRLDSLIGTAREGADEAAEAARRSAETQKQIAEERFEGIVADIENEIEAVRRSELANAQRDAVLKAGVGGDEARKTLIEDKVAALFAEREAQEAARKEQEEADRASARARQAVEELVASLEADIAVMNASDPVLREMIGLRGTLAAATDGERRAIEGLIAAKQQEAALDRSRASVDALRERVAGARDRRTAEERFGKGRGAAAERDAFVFVEAERRRLLAAGIEGARLEAELLKIQKEANELFSSAPDAFFGGGRSGASGSGRVKKEVDTLSKVFEEFGQRFGGTLEFQERQIEAWRIKTLEALRAAGLGHEQYAEMVDQIARDRLAEAYQEDLQNRDDWAAGVERGLAKVFDAQRSMADIAEEVVTDAFSGLEDAFVSLAKTGKIETEQMVDFVLRQLFRLAAQAAISNVTGAGGAGGGIFGGIVGNLFSLFAGPAPGSTASILHDGGIAGRDGQTRVVDPSVFTGAKRLHVGGLAGNEVPAILEEDERVLTLAQQQSTAETIRGLAALAADPGGGAPLSAAAPVINVNVIGAPAQPRVSQPRQNGDGTFDIDIVFDQIEERLAGNVARGRGIAPAIGDRFNLRGRL